MALARWLATIGRPLAVGVTVGAITYLLIRLLAALAETSGLCTGCNATDQGDVLTAVSVAGTTVGASAAKGWLEKVLGGVVRSSGPVPVFMVKKVIDIGSADTDEEAARRAMDEYRDLIMIKDAPPGSAGGDINDAIDRFLDFGTGKTEIGPDEDGNGGG